MNKKEEIFTIGDKCKEGIILSFSIIHGRCRVNFTGGHSLDLKLVNKIKQPLLKTEDGVDIYEGDSIYFVNKNLYIGIYRIINVRNKFKKDPSRIYFANIEKAKEYNMLNYKSLSIKDIEQYLTENQVKELINKIKNG